MCTRFVYRGDNIITGFNFDIDIVEWNHKVINTKDCFYIGIMRPDGMRHSYHGVNRNGNVGTLLYVHGNLSGTYQDSKDCITIADLQDEMNAGKVSTDYRPPELTVMNVETEITTNMLLIDSLSVGLLILFSTCAASVLIFRKKPKDILSEMS